MKTAILAMAIGTLMASSAAMAARPFLPPHINSLGGIALGAAKKKLGIQDTAPWGGTGIHFKLVGYQGRTTFLQVSIPARPAVYVKVSKPAGARFLQATALDDAALAKLGMCSAKQALARASKNGGLFKKVTGTVSADGAAKTGFSRRFTVTPAAPVEVPNRGKVTKLIRDINVYGGQTARAVYAE